MSDKTQKVLVDVFQPWSNMIIRLKIPDIITNSMLDMTDKIINDENSIEEVDKSVIDKILNFEAVFEEKSNEQSIEIDPAIEKERIEKKVTILWALISNECHSKNKLQINKIPRK